MRAKRTQCCGAVMRAFDPQETLGVHCGNGSDAGLSPYQSTYFSGYNHPQGRETRRLTGPASHQNRVYHQPQDRQHARSDNADRSACSRRRGDRVAAQRTFVCCICSRPLLAHRVVSPRRINSVAIGGIADIARSTAALGPTRNDPLQNSMLHRTSDRPPH